jgi:hypothetical protein
MKKYFTFVFVLLLAACVPTTSTDLYSDAQNSRATADAANYRADMNEQALTATSNAPLIRITETAAAMVVAQTQQSMNATATAIQWTPTPDATGTMAAFRLAAQGTEIANNVQRDNLELERQTYTNRFWAWLPGIAFVIVVSAGVMGMIWIGRREKYRPAPVDERGNILPMLNTVDGVWTDVDRMPNYLSGATRKDMLLLPAITADRQDAVTQRDQMTDLVTRGLPGGTATGGERRQVAKQQTALLEAGQNRVGRFKMLSDGNGLEVIDGEIIQTLDNEWKEKQLA